MTLETTVNNLTLAVTTLTTSVQDKRTVLDNAAQQAAASLTTTQGLQAQAATSAATAAAKATEATNNATQVAAYKTAAAALNTSTTATAAVTNLLPDMLAKKDPARHPFRKKMPTLVLDFERQKCHRYAPGSGFGETALSSFMTFARNSTATYTGPDGLIKTAVANEARYDYDPLTGECKGLLIEEQRTNLLTYSNRFDNAIWNKPSSYVKQNQAIAPDGTFTASKVYEDTATAGHGIRYNPFSLTSGTTYTFSIYVKAAEISYVCIDNYTGSSDIVGCIDLNTGNVTSGTAISSAYIGGGWYRVSQTFTATATVSTPYAAQVYTHLTGTGSVTHTGTYGAGIYVWGAQLEVGAFPTSYIPSTYTWTARASTATYLDSTGILQTAASGVARSAAYDYDADGVLRPIGLLLESSATNQLLYSEQFDNAAWNKYNGGVAVAPIVTANYGVAPDGQTTADRVVFALNGGSTISDISELHQAQTTVAGTTYTQSVWLKTTDASTKTVQLSFNGEIQKLITVTGTWQRFSNTGVASNTDRGFRLSLRGTTGTSDSADLLVWGAQQGVGNYPTSYIATTSAQVTRAADTSTSAQATRVADDAKVDGANFSNFYNQLAGTAVTEFSAGMLGGAGYPGAFSVSDGGVNNRFGGCIADGDGDRVQTNLRVNGTYAPAVFSAQAVTVGQAAKIGIRISRAGWSGAVSGGSTVGTGAAVMPQTMSILKVGVFDTPLNGPVKRITYYPQPFTNEELQAVTSV